MTRGMRRLLLVLNRCAALFFALAWAYFVWLAPLHASAQVTELDRAGAINEAKLKAYHPPLAENLRANLGPWVAADALYSGIFVSQIGLVISIVNLVVLHVAGVRADRNERLAGPGVQGTP